MITRARLLLLAAAVVLSTAGCSDDCPEGGLDRSFSWPESVKCPPADEAALYMVDFKSPGDCGISIVSVDRPGIHTKDGCTYSITVETCSDGCHIN
jgi:hypothetical protein